MHIVQALKRRERINVGRNGSRKLIVVQVAEKYEVSSVEMLRKCTQNTCLVVGVRVRKRVLIERTVAQAW